jgi:hypothetical protein
MAPLTPPFAGLGLIEFAGLYAAQSREAVDLSKETAATKQLYGLDSPETV